MTDRQYLIPTVPGMGRGIVNHDDRSKAFRAMAMLPTTAPYRNRTWRRGLPYDQGQTPKCVPFTGKGILNTLLLSRRTPYRLRSRYSTDAFYAGAQQRDEWPGEAYDGTSGLGLCRYLLDTGMIHEYRWCFGLDDVILTLGHIGPVGLGVWWYHDMFTPVDGFIAPGASQPVGGHEVELTGVNIDGEYVTLTNSWGWRWGRLGRAKLRFADLERLLDEDGDAFVITS